MRSTYTYCYAVENITRILAALLLEHSGHPDAGRRIRDAVDADVDARGGASRATHEVGDAIVDRIRTSKEQA